MKSLSFLDSNSLKEYISGLNAIIDGEEELAIELLKSAVKKDSDLQEAYFQLSKLYFKKGDHTRSQKILKDLLLRSSLEKGFQKKVELQLLPSLLKAKKFNEAQELAQKRISNSPQDTPYRLYLIEGLERQNLYKEAEKHWKAYAHQMNFSHKPRFALYKVELSRKAASEKIQIELLNQALKLDPACAPAYLLLSKIYRNSESFKKVTHVWSQLLREIPEKAYWIFTEMENYFFDNNQFDNLRKIYTDLSQQEGPHQFFATLALANYHMKKGEVTDSMNGIYKACKMYTGKDPALLSLTKSLSALKKQKALDESAGKLFLMLAAIKHYQCQSCNHISPQPEWHCPECGSWNSFFYDSL